VSQRSSRAFQESLWELQKRWGDQVLVPARELNKIQSFPTGFAEVDALLSLNGIPQGHLTEFVGMPTSGLTTVVWKVLSHIQQSGTPAVYIDLSKTFDPFYAAWCGVDLDNLLLVQPKTAAEAFEMARNTLKITRSIFIVLDAMTAMPVPPMLSTLLKRLHEPLAASKAALIILLPASQSGQLSTYAHTRLRIEREAWLYQQGDLAGYRVRLTVLKDKGASGHKQTCIDLYLDSAVDGDVP
jgi:recombination protein RecA